MRACENCRHWSAYNTGPYGQCRRFPPKVSQAGQLAWPETNKALWCGEFHQSAASLLVKRAASENDSEESCL